MLELKGVDISKLRTKLGKLTDAQRKREFGLVRRLNRELTNGIKKENKVIAHIAVLLTLLIIVGLLKPLTGAMGRGDNAAVARVATMLVLGVVAMVAFVRSFIAARKARG